MQAPLGNYFTNLKFGKILFLKLDNFPTDCPTCATVAAQPSLLRMPLCKCLPPNRPSILLLSSRKSRPRSRLRNFREIGACRVRALSPQTLCPRKRTALTRLFNHPEDLAKSPRAVWRALACSLSIHSKYGAQDLLFAWVTPVANPARRVSYQVEWLASNSRSAPSSRRANLFKSRASFSSRSAHSTCSISGCARTS